MIGWIDLEPLRRLGFHHFNVIVGKGGKPNNLLDI